MTILKPLFFVGRTFNTAANIYFAGQVSWWAYKNIREMQKEKLHADTLKEQFVSEYREEHGEDPTDELVSIALRSYNAVEHPLQQRIKKVVGLSDK